MDKIDPPFPERDNFRYSLVTDNVLCIGNEKKENEENDLDATICFPLLVRKAFGEERGEGTRGRDRQERWRAIRRETKFRKVGFRWRIESDFDANLQPLPAVVFDDPSRGLYHTLATKDNPPPSR